MPSHNNSLNLLKNNPLYIKTMGFREQFTLALLVVYSAEIYMDGQEIRDPR